MRLAVFRGLVIYRFKELFDGVDPADVCFCRGRTMYPDDAVMTGSDESLKVAIRSKSIVCEFVLPGGETCTSMVPETAQVKDLHKFFSPDVPAAVFAISGQIWDPEDYICMPLFDSTDPRIAVMGSVSVMRVQVNGCVFSFDVKTGASFQEILDSAVKERLAILGDSPPCFVRPGTIVSMEDAFLPIDDQPLELHAAVTGQYVTFVPSATGQPTRAEIPLDAKIGDLPRLLLTVTGVTGKVEVDGRDAGSLVSEVWKGAVVFRYSKLSAATRVSSGIPSKGSSSGGLKFPKRQARREVSGSRVCPATPAPAEDDSGGIGSAYAVPSVLLQAGLGHGIELAAQDLPDLSLECASRAGPAPDLPPPESPAEPASDLPPGKEYKFRLEDSFFRLRIGDTETVGDVKVKIADRESTTPDMVTLLYVGKSLKDCMVIRTLRVPQDGKIVVYIRSNRSIVLYSVGL
jgi:hypothetical protein